MSIRREDLTSEWVQKRYARIKEEGLFEPLTDAERESSLNGILAQAQPGKDLWLFGYGSLMWNPTVYYVGKKTGIIYGHHRRYCFWVKTGRGTPEMPGLMLGLDRGGSCRGLAFRIKATQVRQELELIWRREMLSGVYQPRWVCLHTPQGKFPAVTFVVDPSHPQYVKKLSLEKTAQHIAKAAGWLGSCRSYLEDTIAQLHQLGVSDRYLNRLQQLVCRHDPASSS